MILKNTKSELVVTIDDKTQMDSPEVTIDEIRIKPEQKLIEITCQFKSGKSIAVRDIGSIKYDSDWSIAEIEKYVSDFVSSRELKDTKKK